jgi:hypothetical protein
MSEIVEMSLNRCRENYSELLDAEFNEGDALELYTCLKGTIHGQK